MGLSSNRKYTMSMSSSEVTNVRLDMVTSLNTKRLTSTSFNWQVFCWFLVILLIMTFVFINMQVAVLKLIFTSGLIIR